MDEAREPLEPAPTASSGSAPSAARAMVSDPPIRSPLTARLAALIALLAFAAVVVLLVVYVTESPVGILGPIVGFALGLPLAWTAATRQRFRVPLAVLAALLLIGGFVWLLVLGPGLVILIGVPLASAVAITAGTFAFRWEVDAACTRRWTDAPPARQPVLLMNPRSGGGKVERFKLVDEAKRRHVEPIMLKEGDDLRALAVKAIEGGADVIGMAGGDGSQAVVASVAVEHGVAFVCVPAGTRNHLALDLGLNRRDVVGALDAFGHARQGRMDLASVNGRIFVNNVSLGVYAEVVASEAYRDAKLATVSAMLPQLLGPDAPPFDLRVQPEGEEPIVGPQIVLVSNDPYRLDNLAGFGTRPRLDRGELGATALHLQSAAETARFLAYETAGRVDQYPGWHSWSATTVVIESSRPIAAGVDGESCSLDPPLRCESHPKALTVRIPRHHPGISPAARHPGFDRSTFHGLARIVVGRPSGLVDAPVGR